MFLTTLGSDPSKDLEELAESLELGLKDNIKDFIDGFEQIGVNYAEKTSPVQESAPTTDSTDTDSQENKEEKDNKKESKTQGVSGAIAPNAMQGNVSNMPVLNSRLRSNSIVDTFLNASPEEQKFMLDNYGFEDLKANMMEIGPFKRRKLINAMNAQYINSFPEYSDFESAIDLLAGTSGINKTKLYKSFFDKNGHLMQFSKMDVKALKQMQDIINEFNANRKNLSEDQIQYFDKNFMQFVKNGAMLQAAKQGRIQNFLSNFSKKNPIYSGIINSVGAYTRQNARTLEMREQSNNRVRNVRDRLGLNNQVVNEPQYTSHDSKLDPSRHIDDRTM